MISPTIGRKVWFRPHGILTVTNPTTGMPEMISERDASQPMDASVVFVHNDRCVNLAVSDHHGRLFAVTGVTLLQEGDAVPATGWYAEWMPYQKGQAAKVDAAPAPAPTNFVGQAEGIAPAMGEGA